MLIKKEIIRFNGQDMNVKFDLNSNDNFTGYQQEINVLTLFTSTDLVNPVIDGETSRYKHYQINGDIELGFNFVDSLGQINPLFINAGFTGAEIHSNDTKLLNSFFILDFYDTYNPNTQNKIFSTYLTKILNSDYDSNYSIYKISPTIPNQFYYWNIPKSFTTEALQTTDSNDNNIIIGYVMFSFYSAKDGSVRVFYNIENENTPQKMFFKVELDITNKTWRILTNSYLIYAYELKSSTDIYAIKISESINKLNNNKQDYPLGNAFNYIGRNYVTT